jgi:hypothetical protein
MQLIIVNGRLSIPRQGKDFIMQPYDEMVKAGQLVAP